MPATAAWLSKTCFYVKMIAHSDSEVNKYTSTTVLHELLSCEYYDGCMIGRDRRLVKAAGLLLAVYNGERRGDTVSTVQYARMYLLHSDIAQNVPEMWCFAGKG